MRTEVPYNDTDRLLINSSTTVTIGNGDKAYFWHHNWLEGEAPRYLAPQLFKLVHMKNRMICQQLHNGNWSRALQVPITTTQLQEFIGLWIRLQNVQLLICKIQLFNWKWTADGAYSTSSAYRTQFRGSHRKIQHDLIWKERSENQCKIHKSSCMTKS
jgi:hypothetical protein